MAYGRIYPEQLDLNVILRTGQSIRVRLISPEDKKKLEELFYRLSHWTRYLRFGYSKNYITESELEYFTELDPPGRYAYIATVGEGDEERIVAVGRWFLSPGGADAEVAFVVDDNLQVRGVGTALLEHLASAAVRYKIKFFTARVLPENTRMLEVFVESGFRIEKHLDEGAYSISINLEEQEEFSKRQEYREHVARSAGVRKLLYPRSVAVVGASRKEGSIGGAVFRNLLMGGFKGTVFPVNPNSPSVGGVLSYASVLEVPGDIDLAVIAVPAEAVLDVIEECGKKGVWGVVIISAGFSEAGPAGRERERMLREKALSYGMRVIGPNCLGILNSDEDVRLNATFSPITPPSGNLSIGSQSGALGLALLDYANSMSLGIYNFVSIGNRMDISSNDLLEFWEDEPDTDVIVLYLESFGNPRKFSRIARRVTRVKPVIAIKAGRSEVGARAATSHTGALAAAEVAVEAVFRQAGIIQVNTIEEMFNVARYLTSQPLPAGPRVGILTNAGGPGVLAADACESYGLKVVPLSEETRNKLREFLPPEAALANPVDMIASAPADSYRKALSVLLADNDLDSILVIYIPPLVTKPADIAAAVREAMLDYKGPKPVIACFMTTREIRANIPIEPGRVVPSFIFPEEAVQALGHGYHYSLYKGMETGKLPRFEDIDEEAAQKLIQPLVTEEGSWLMPEVGARLLGLYGIPCAEVRVAFTRDEALREASAIGFPVVMKIRSSTIVHKTDVEGVVLDIKNEKEAGEAFDSLQAGMTAAGLARYMQGVILQPMVYGGQEVIAGIVQDPVFGPLVMVGLGGIQVELMKDVSFSLHPLTELDPARMLAQLKSFPLLVGWRGRPRRDIEALKNVLLRFSVLIEDFAEIEQMEINPLVVLGEGLGCSALDARIFIKKQGFSS